MAAANIQLTISARKTIWYYPLLGAAFIYVLLGGRMEKAVDFVVTHGISIKTSRPTQTMRVHGIDKNSLFNGSAMQTIAQNILDFPGPNEK